MSHIHKTIHILLGLLLLGSPGFAQFSTCDSNLINAHLNPAGYRRVYVPTQPCSMYFYSTAPKTGINAHRDAANLNVPQLIIDNVQENNDVSAALFGQGVYAIPGSGNAVWLGITDSSTIFSWRVMATGQPATFFNWTAGDPNNLRPGCYNSTFGCALCTGTNAYWCAYGEDCAIMQPSGQWIDNSCDGTLTGNPTGSPINRTVILELNTCPVIQRPHDTLLCSGNPVNLSTAVVSGGTAPYTYTWNPGGQTGPSITVSPTTATTYTVEASDHYLCKADSTVTVSVATPVTPIINATSPVCKNTNDNISLSTTSPTATYAWSFGPGSSIISGSAGGPYVVQWAIGGTKNISVTVTDNGCSATATRTLRVDSADAAFTLNPTTSCTGQSVTATVTNVSPTATYSWSFGGGTGTGTTSGPYTITWSTTGIKTVGITVTDNGCTVNSSSTVNITAGPAPTVTLNPSTTACQGEAVSVTLNGTFSGTATYSWNFNGGTVISGSGAGPYSVSWNTSGTKNVDVTVTDGGCSGTSPVQSITITGAITAVAGADISICPGVAGQLGAAPTAGYSYSWSPALGLSNPSIANPTITIPINPTGTAIDTIFVLITSQGTCSATDSVRVTLYPTPTSTFTISPTTTCQNSNVTITYTGSASSGASYNWNFNGGTVSSGSGQGPYTVSWASTGSQNVDLTVTENTCPSTPTTHSVTISNSMTVAFTLNPATTACAGQPVAVTLTGSPSGTATYTWDFHGGNVISGSGAGPYSVSWNTNGTQNADLTVTDGGCTGTAATQSITIANTVTADAGSPVQLCPTVAGSLGSAPIAGYTYSWTPTWGLSNASAADPTITIPNNPTGAIIDTFYVVTATSGSCSAMDTVQVRIYPDIDNNFTVSSSSTCTGDNVTFTYSGTVSGTATYNWNFAGGNVVSGTGPGPYTVNWPAQGTKTVSLDITDNGCTGTAASTTVTVGSRPTAIAGNDTTVCSGNNVQLGSPATGGVTYAWTPATHLSNAGVSDPVFSETNTGGTNDVTNYMLIATSTCADTAYVNVTVTPVAQMSIVLSGPATFCQGDSVVLSDNLAPQADYLWSTTETTAIITVKSSATITLTTHDAAGCTYISNPPVVITVNPNPSLALAPGGQTDESCPGANDGSLTVQAANGTPAYNYTWSTTPPQNGATATGLTPASYDVSVTDNNGCTASATYAVNAAPPMTLNVDSVQNLTCNNQSDGAITVSVTGGSAPISYLWSTGATTPAITHLSADTFSVTATDSRGCAADTSVVISQPVPIAFANVSPLHITYGGSEEITITITPATNYIYSWSPAGTLSCANCPNPVASPLLTTTYMLTVTDPIGGCSGIDTVTLFVDPSKQFYVPNAFTPNNDGINDLYQVFASGPVKVFEISIFDRWGEKVYESNDIGAGWDGKYHGVFASNGMYVYDLNITFLDGQTLSNKGSLTLLK